MTTSDLIETRDAWDVIATGYDEFVTPSHIWLGEHAVRRAGLAEGVRFLDVAAGSGAMSIPAARCGAQVLATDLSPTMLDRLAARAGEEGLPAIDTAVMDGHALALEDDVFDVAGSQFGVMLFPDLPRALAEMARVTKPGGRILLVVYGPPDQVEFLSVFLGALQKVVPDFEGLPVDPPPLPFQVADPEKLRRALADVASGEISVETITESMRFGSAADMWNWVVNSNPIGAMLVADLSSEQRAEVEEVLGRMLAERAVDGTAVLTNPVHIAVATV